MALQLSIEDKSGCMRNEAYAKISFFGIDQENVCGTIKLSLYHSKQAKDDGKGPIKGEVIEVPFSIQDGGDRTQFDKIVKAMEDHGPKKVAYVIAKKLDALKAAQDILEDGQEALTDADVGLA